MSELSDSYAQEIVRYLKYIADNSNPNKGISNNHSGTNPADQGSINKDRFDVIEEEYKLRRDRTKDLRAAEERYFRKSQAERTAAEIEAHKLRIKEIEAREEADRQYYNDRIKYELDITEERIKNEEDLESKREMVEEHLAQLEKARKSIKDKEERKALDKKIKDNKNIITELDKAQTQIDLKNAKNREERINAEKKQREQVYKDIENLWQQANDTADKVERRLINREARKLSWQNWGPFEGSTSGLGGFINEIRSADNPLALGNVLSNALDGVNKEINSLINDVTSHRQKIMARLQGYGESSDGEYDYEGLLEDIRDQLAVSPYLKQQDYLKKLDDAVEKGIAYNVEQRTFLASISEQIATTFNAFNSELLRLIKLQQADSTAARLGMEAVLTKNLNSMFSDTSYLTDNISDGVTAALLDTESLMTHEDAVEFEYTAQKWLSAMYSLGVSQNTIARIAEGIGKLGTGNVTALANDTATQTLFAMSASREGLDYAQMLVDGLDSSEINRLLKSMVTYLQQISKDSKNNVVKSAYGDLYNISLADLTAVNSLTQSDIDTIFSSGLTYDDAANALNDQLSNLSKRYSTSEMLQNIVSNFKYTLASEIAGDAVTMTMWQVTDFINNATGGIHLPHIAVMGNTIDLSAFTVEGLIQGGLVGLATLGSIGSIISSIGAGGGMDLSSWGGEEYNTRGGIITTSSGFKSTTSQSTYVASSSSNDMRNSALSSATEDAEDVSSITNANNDTEHTFDEFYTELFDNGHEIVVTSSSDDPTNSLYTAMYIDRNPVPISIESLGQSSDVLNALIESIISLGELKNSVMDVNVVNSDTSIPISLNNLNEDLKNEIITFINDTVSQTIAEKIKSVSLGYDSSDNSSTVSKVMSKINNGDAEVTVKDIADNDFENLVNHLQLWGGLF